MTNTQELRTVYTMDTTDADRGVQRIERAFDRLEKAEKRAVNERASREAAREEAQALRYREQLTKEAAERRVAITRSEYSRLDKLERDRQAQLRNTMRMQQGQGRVGIGQSAGERAAAGGFMGNGNNRRLAGDAINMAAGTSGWVMKLDALAHFGARLGGLAAGGMMMGKAYSANDRVREARDGLQGAMGERVNAKWMEYDSLRYGMGLLPQRFRSDPYTVARGDMQSAEGMGEQRANIQEELKKTQESRRGFSGYFASMWKGVTGSRTMDKSFEAEVRAQDKLLQLDDKIAGKTKEKTAAQRVGVLESEKEGRLAQNRLEMEAKIAELNDANRAGKIGDGERVAGIRAAESTRGLADLETMVQARAQRRAVAQQNELTYIGRRGEDVEMRGAGSRLRFAQSAQGDAHTSEQKASAAAAVDAARLEYEQADRNTRERKQSLAIDREIASFRGGAEARTMNAAVQGLRKEKELLAIAKERGADAEREAQVRVAAAELTLSLTKQEMAARQFSQTAAMRGAEIGMGNSRFAIGQRMDSQDGNVRFAAGQAIERKEAAGKVEMASTEVDRANSTVEAQIKEQGEASAAALSEQKLAQTALNRAKVEQLNVEKMLRFEAAERQRGLTAERDAARNETAAIRMENSGRGDRAAVMRGRSESGAQALEFQRQGRPGMAAEVQEQQRQREVGAYLDKYTRPDGRKRSRSEVNREERELRKVERRRNRRTSELEKNGGLINVRRDIGGNVMGGMDPLTREQVTAEQLYNRKQQPARQAAKERDEGTKTFNDIYAILNERLPKETR